MGVLELLGVIPEWSAERLHDYLLLPGWAHWLVAITTPAVISIGERIAHIMEDEQDWLLDTVRMAGGIAAAAAALALIAAGAVLALALWQLYGLSDPYRDAYLYAPSAAITRALWGVVIGMALGIAGTYAVGRYLEPAVSRLVVRLTRSTAQDASSADAWHVADTLPTPAPYRPAQYFDAARGWFVGLDEAGDPVYISAAQWRESHIQILGPTGTGKGITSSVLLTQSLRMGDAVVVLDPKHDRWAPQVMRRATERLGSSYAIADLTGAGPALDLIGDLSSEALRRLLYTTLRLERQGEDSDYYRIGDRELIHQLTQLRQDWRGVALADLHRIAAAELDAATIKAATNAMGQLRDLQRTPAAQGCDGLRLPDCIARSSCLYVLGSIKDEDVMLVQRFVAARLVDLLEEWTERPHTTVMLDEFKYWISPRVLQALGTIRDKGANLLLTHQSVGDLEDVPADMNPTSVRRGVVDNTALKWAYRAADQETAEWVAQQTGTVWKERPRTEIERTPEGGETRHSRYMADKVERYTVEPTQVLSMPSGCAVCIRPGALPRFALAHYIQVQDADLTPYYLRAGQATPQPSGNLDPYA